MFVRLCWNSTLRPGNVVLYHLPAGHPLEGIEIGLVISVWHGVRNPKMTSSPTRINSLTAFRVVSLDTSDEDPANESSVSRWGMAGNTFHVDLLCAFVLLYTLYTLFVFVGYIQQMTCMYQHGSTKIKINEGVPNPSPRANIPRSGFAQRSPNAGLCGQKHWCASWTLSAVLWPQGRFRWDSFGEPLFVARLWVPMDLYHSVVDGCSCLVLFGKIPQDDDSLQNFAVNSFL